MDLEYTVCNLCHADDTVTLFEGRDHLHGLPGDFPVVECRHCGLIYVNPRPTQQAMKVYYPEDYEPHVFFEQIRHNRLARLDYYYGLGKRRRAIERLSRVGKLLDVGCGSGGFIYYMREHGWEVRGQEVSPSAVEYARAKLDLDVHLGHLRDAELSRCTYDVVTLWNVLEHLPDPIGSLIEIRRLLKPDGLVVIAVPNRASWAAKLFGSAWVGYDVPRHLYTYTETTLGLLLRKTGFHTVDMRYLFGSYQALADSLTFALNQKTGHGNLLQDAVESATRLRALRVLAAPILRAADALGKGSIITAFCRPTKQAGD